MLPSEEFCLGGMLQSLRALGMRTVLSLDGVLESARRIEFEAKNLSIEEVPDIVAVDLIRKRAFALLNFLDDESAMTEFLKNDQVANNDEVSYEQDSREIEISVSTETSCVIDELNDIGYLLSLIETIVRQSQTRFILLEGITNCQKSVFQLLDLLDQNLMNGLSVDQWIFCRQTYGLQFWQISFIGINRLALKYLLDNLLLLPNKAKHSYILKDTNKHFRLSPRESMRVLIRTFLNPPLNNKKKH